MKKDIICLVFAGLSLIVSIFKLIPLPFDAAWIAIILCGVPIIIEAVIGLVTEFDIKADVLVSIALIASVLIGEDFAAGEVAFIMQVGALLEDITVAKARDGIEKLVKLSPQTARRVVGSREETIDVTQVQVNDVIRVLPGETVPVDGIILRGETSINQAVMTGESMPVDKTVDDEVSSGTVNQYGAFEMRATRVGEDSSIQRMIRLVQSADAGKAKIVGMADRWATWIVVIALTASLITWMVSGEIIRAVTILVVFCPCSLVLATPTAIMAAIGNATKHGFLIREGDALERLANVSKVTFDKTGTLTVGKPVVSNVVSVDKNYSEEEIFRMTASVEAMSEHPLGRAIVSSYRDLKDENITEVEDFHMIPGQGVFAKVEGKEVMAGNIKMIKEEQIAVDDSVDAYRKEAEYLGSTIIYVAADKKIVGIISLNDTVRQESLELIEKLKDLNITPVLLTGDNENAARETAKRIGIAEYRSECLPEDKLNSIKSYQNKGEQVCMIGDGINDVPALKTAAVGIAMGGVGSDIAIDAADIVLVDDELKELPHLLALSRKMMRMIKSNLSISMGLNFAAIVLAMTGILNPVVGALVHNAGSIFVIVNSTRLLCWSVKEKETEKNHGIGDLLQPRIYKKGNLLN